MNDGILIYDIETATVDGKPNPNKDKLKMFGCYSFTTGKYYFLTNKDDIRKVIQKHKYFVGFNTVGYDNMVLHNNGFSDLMQIGKHGKCNVKYKINIDLMDIFKKRAVIMKINKTVCGSNLLNDILMSYSLDYITKTLDLVSEEDGKIKDFDYSILNKDIWTEEDKLTIKRYLKRDVEITKKLYEWLEDYFHSFKDFLNQKDIDSKKYLTTRPSVFAYKAICHALGWKEEYNDGQGESYSGGYVAFPAGKHFEGLIYCLDFNSLYPSIFHQCNLYSMADMGWTGNGAFKVKGVYNNELQGQIEKLLIQFYEKRLVYKAEKDKREYTIKIVINIIYGLSGNIAFKHLYNDTTASDCTSLARQWVMLARKMFRDAGYKIIYTDTDSVYIVDVFNDKDKMLAVKEEIIAYIKGNVPFPSKHFDMGIDDEITDMWFFKGKAKTDKEDEFMDEDDFLYKPLGLMKKNYIYRTTDGKIKVKNLGVRKKSTSTLTREIFWDYLAPKISEERKVTFSKTFFRNLINKLLEEDLKRAAIRYKVNAANTYKTESQIQSQIARQYGEGIHFLIPNTRFGIGKKKRYCTIEEFKAKGMTIDDIELENVWRELSYFITPPKKVDLSTWGI